MKSRNSKRKYKILILDDEPEFLDLIKNPNQIAIGLEISGIAHNVKSALEKLKTDAFDHFLLNTKFLRFIPVLQGDETYFFFNSEQNKIRISLSSIIYIEKRGKHSVVHTQERTYNSRKSLDKLLLELESKNFLRIHRQYVVNSIHIREIHPIGSGRYNAYLNDSEDTVLTVGRRYAKDLLDSFHS